MSVLTKLQGIVGDWQGTNLLWLSENPLQSETVATVKSAAGGTCLCIEYNWRYEGELQEGILLLGTTRDGSIQGVWRDSFHSSDAFFISDGNEDEAGAISMLGRYAAPPEADWGWRTEVKSDGESRFEIEMTNISPEGEESVAVRMEFHRIEAN